MDKGFSDRLPQRVNFVGQGSVLGSSLFAIFTEFSFQFDSQCALFLADGIYLFIDQCTGLRMSLPPI